MVIDQNYIDTMAQLETQPVGEPGDFEKLMQSIGGNFNQGMTDVGKALANQKNNPNFWKALGNAGEALARGEKAGVVLNPKDWINEEATQLANQRLYNTMFTPANVPGPTSTTVKADSNGITVNKKIATPTSVANANVQGGVNNSDQKSITVPNTSPEVQAVGIQTPEPTFATPNSFQQSPVAQALGEDSGQIQGVTAPQILEQGGPITGTGQSNMFGGMGTHEVASLMDNAIKGQGQNVELQKAILASGKGEWAHGASYTDALGNHRDVYYNKSDPTQTRSVVGERVQEPINTVTQKVVGYKMGPDGKQVPVESTVVKSLERGPDGKLVARDVSNGEAISLLPNTWTKLQFIPEGGKVKHDYQIKLDNMNNIVGSFDLGVAEDEKRLAQTAGSSDKFRAWRGPIDPATGQSAYKILPAGAQGPQGYEPIGDTYVSGEHENFQQDIKVAGKGDLINNVMLHGTDFKGNEIDPLSLKADIDFVNKSAKNNFVYVYRTVPKHAMAPFLGNETKISTEPLPPGITSDVAMRMAATHGGGNAGLIAAMKEYNELQSLRNKK